MDPDVALHLEIAAVVVTALIVVGVAVMASGGACDDAAAVHAADVESALGGDTLMTYEQATTGKKRKEEEERCAICLSEYGEGELVRMVPACGHFYHASCDVDRWLRKRGTCPLCRGRLWPPLPRPECPPMPPRMPSSAAC